MVGSPLLETFEQRLWEDFLLLAPAQGLGLDDLAGLFQLYHSMDKAGEVGTGGPSGSLAWQRGVEPGSGLWAGS